MLRQPTAAVARMSLMIISPARSVAVPSREPAVPIFNAHLVSVRAGDAPGIELLTNVEIAFAEPRHGMGGHVSQIAYRDGAAGGVGVRIVYTSPAERVRAQAALDAIVASGLLTQPLPGNDWKRPAVGRSRLYLDKRARMIEFDTASPPPALQPIIDAMTAWRRGG